MKTFLNIMTLVMLATAATVPAVAQDFARSLEMINESNRLPALQNPKYDRARDMLKRRVLDSKKKAVGEIEDVLFAGNGRINALQVKFDRLRLNAPVMLDYHELDIAEGADTYGLGFDEEQITAMYPQLLANIETAAGEEGDTFSLSRTLGARVNAEDGRKLGTVNDVLFSADGNRAEALYVTLNYGVSGGKSVAIPIEAAKFSGAANAADIKVSDGLADAMLDYAKRK